MKWLHRGLLALWIVLCCLLDIFLVYSLRIPMLTYFVIGIELLGFMIIVMRSYSAKNECIALVGDLSRLLEQMMSLEKEEVFEPLEESVTSKLQVQVTRLANILQMQSIRNRQAKEEMESLVSDIAHQLKTPLTNVGLYAQLLEDKNLDEDIYKTFYEGLCAEVDKLQFLLNELIKMSRLESGSIKICEEEAVIQETCLKAIKSVYLKAKQKQISLLFEGGEDMRVYHDPKWSAEALMNILDNAIKYSSPQTKIGVRIIPYEYFVRIDVEDEGIGISEAEYTQIFKRFYRGKVDARIDGIGIGLYLSRKIIDMQKGSIKVKSKEGEGSTFSIMLPLNKKSA
ncbi:MAG: sensor histidine kinase [Cellulosilyticaceae bacterium]